MIDSTLESIDVLIGTLIGSYGPILLDLDVLMALGSAWALTHIIKQTEWFRALGVTGPYRRKETYDKNTRMMAVILSAVALCAFKWGDGESDKVVNVCIFMALASPYIYKGVYNLIRWKLPGLAQIMTGEPKDRI